MKPDPLCLKMFDALRKFILAVLKANQNRVAEMYGTQPHLHIKLTHVSRYRYGSTWSISLAHHFNDGLELLLPHRPGKLIFAAYRFSLN